MKYAGAVSKTIQIRDVPDDVHAALRSKAAAEGLSLSEFMLRTARMVAERPSAAEVLMRASHRSWGVARGEAGAAVRASRDDLG
jgi:plasmid stability protein